MRLTDIDRLAEECKEPYVWWETETQMKGILSSVPTIEIIPCAECVFWESTPSNTVAPQFHRCMRNRNATKANEFCSRGMRDETD